MSDDGRPVGFTRRSAIGAGGAFLLGACVPVPVQKMRGVHDRLRELDQFLGGRLGVAMVTASGKSLATYRAEERFAMCSTFKAPLAAAVLARVASGGLSLEEELPFSSEDLVPYAPVVRRHLEQGRLRVEQLCQAAVQLSDNVAANLLLRRLGGPATLTEFFRGQGDEQSRLDRLEPDLNENATGDLRDTTTPLSMAGLMAHLLYSSNLGAERRVLRDWLAGSRTGKSRIRAGAPGGWVVGNKTGTAPSNAPAFCDVAFMEPPIADPVVLAVYCDRPNRARVDVEAGIAEVARICSRDL